MPERPTGTHPGIDLSWAEAQFPGAGAPPCELRLCDAPDFPGRVCPHPAVCNVVLYHLGDREQAIPACAVHYRKAVDHADGHGGVVALCAGCRAGCRAWIFLLRVEPLGTGGVSDARP